jgi:putative ABC transport system substrate-binding protein
VNRREFIMLLGGAAVAWPLAARGQQGERLRRVGILMPYPENEPDIQARVRAFKQELQRLGWIEGSKIEFDERWATDNMDVVRSNAASLLERKPDAVIAIGGRVIPILKQMTRSVPIVVAGTGDPLGTGMVASLAHPGENITGFSLLELSIIGKFVELLKQMAPNVSRVSLIFNPDNPSTRYYKQEFENTAPALAIEPMVAHIHGLDDVERAIEERAASPNGGLLFAPDVTVTALRERIVALVARSRLPAIYSDPAIVKSGGLASYSADRIEIFRRTAAYVDRILRGENAGDLPVQQPTKYELVVNLKTAKTLDLEIPDKLVALADEVIE